MIGPLQMDIDSVEIGLPTREDILGDTSSHPKNDSDISRFVFEQDFQGSQF